MLISKFNLTSVSCFASWLIKQKNGYLCQDTSKLFKLLQLFECRIDVECVECRVEYRVHSTLKRNLLILASRLMDI